MKQFIFLFSFLLLGSTTLLSQDNQVLARSAYGKAEAAFGNGNYQEAEKLLKQAVSYLNGQTNPQLQYLFTKIYFDKKDWLSANKAMESYFELSSEEHQYYLAMVDIAMTIKEEANSIIEAKKKEQERILMAKEKEQELFVKAKDGNSEAQKKLGEMYFSGEGVEQDYSEALKWFQKSGDQNDSNVQFQLGKIYYSREGAKKDYSKALMWYLKAAEQGHCDAAHAVASLYKGCKGVKRNIELSKKWHKKGQNCK